MNIFIKNEGWDRISNRKDNVEGKMRMNLFLTSNSGQINPQKGVSHSCCKSSVLWKKISSRTGSSKKWLRWQGIWVGLGRVQVQVHLQGRGKALEATESAMPGLLEEPEVVQHGCSITSLRMGESLERKIRTLVHTWHRHVLNKVRA